MVIDAVYLLVGLAIVLGVCVTALPLAIGAFVRRSAAAAVRSVVWGAAA